MTRKPPNYEARADKLNQADLWILCKKFVEENQITCSDDVEKLDGVLDSVPEFLQAVCDLVGYYEE